MIARLEGILRELEPTRVVLDVNGVGYELHIPLSTFTELPDEGKRVWLLVHTHMREGILQLYGFASDAEKQAFEVLLKASRVGPKLAQTILSGISPQQLVRAIRDGDPAPLRVVPGVGAKLAQRLVVELLDRVDDLAADVGLDGDTTRIHVDLGPLPGEEEREQTLSALVNLGYSRNQAERATDDARRELDEDSLTVETLVRTALRKLAK